MADIRKGLYRHTHYSWGKPAEKDSAGFLLLIFLKHMCLIYGIITAIRRFAPA